jgi:hypothetical protein
VRLRTARQITWRRNGPVRRVYQGQILAEFFGVPFESAGEALHFEAMELSRASREVLRRKLERLVQDFNELARLDSALKPAERDSVGLVAQRVVATIVNIGCDIAQQGVASPADIDRAVNLGLGYPKGPLAFGDALGARNILAILEAMQDFYGDPRYRPSPWLKRRALLGVSLLTEET